MFTHWIFALSMPAFFASAGNSFSAAAPGGEPTVLPSRSFGFEMPLAFLAMITKGALL